ncbi:MAG: transposase [Chloroflexota bacterium]|nr:transposase [Chloroflexota bacterium]
MHLHRSSARQGPWHWPCCGRRATPHNHGPNVALLATLTRQGIGPTLVVEKAADRPAFKRYMEALLVPILQPVQTVIPDNLSIHTGEEVRRLIEGIGCKLLLLPASSRDITPIEPAFAKIKQALRRAEARIRGAGTAIEWALDAVSVADARLLRPLRLPSPRGQLKRATL